MKKIQLAADEIALIVLVVLFLLMGIATKSARGAEITVRKTAGITTFTTHNTPPVTYKASEYEFLRVRVPAEYYFSMVNRVEMWTTYSSSPNRDIPCPFCWIGENPLQTFAYESFYDVDGTSMIIPVRRGDADMRIIMYIRSSQLPGICGIPSCGSWLIQERIALSQIPYERRRAVSTNR